MTNTLKSKIGTPTDNDILYVGKDVADTVFWIPPQALLKTQINEPVLEGCERALNADNIRRYYATGDVAATLEPNANAAWHERHIAYQMQQIDAGMYDPIQLDVGVPTLGFLPDSVIADGFHRWTAYKVGKHPLCPVVFSGQASTFRDLVAQAAGVSAEYKLAFQRKFSAWLAALD